MAKKGFTGVSLFAIKRTKMSSDQAKRRDSFGNLTFSDILLQFDGVFGPQNIYDGTTAALSDMKIYCESEKKEKENTSNLNLRGKSRITKEKLTPISAANIQGKQNIGSFFPSI